MKVESEVKEELAQTLHGDNVSFVALSFICLVLIICALLFLPFTFDGYICFLYHIARDGCCK